MIAILRGSRFTNAIIKENMILLIDDDPDDRDLFAAALDQACGNSPFMSFGDPVAALSMLAGTRQKVQMFFVDLYMPLMDGFTFIDKLRMIDCYSKVPVIVYSGGPVPEEYAAVCINQGLTLESKPQNYSDLVHILKRHCAFSPNGKP